MPLRAKLLALYRYRLTRREWGLTVAFLAVAIPIDVAEFSSGAPAWLFTVAPAALAVCVALIAVMARSIVRNALAQTR